VRMSRRSLHTYTAGLALAITLSGVPAPAWAGERATPSAAIAAAGIDIDNFGQISDTYYRGAQPKGDDFKALAKLGIKLMIDLAAEGDSAEAANAKAAGMQFVRIPMSTHQPPSPAVIAHFLSLVNDPANQPVYVHCMGGRHRTGVMTAIYRMTEDAWPGARAFQEMKEYKFGADFLHPEFKEFVLKYVAPAAAVDSAK
jgi:tyrosine-protein phosphatase SIW14